MTDEDFDTDFDTGAFVRLAAALNGIEMRPEWRAGVATNLENFRALHRRVAAGAADAPLDPLGLFRP